jgi:Tfp pilus assembly ATPase PilU
LIPAAALAQFDAADSGIVLVFGDSGREATAAWLRDRRTERGERLVRIDSGGSLPGVDGTEVLARARRWDIDTFFCEDCEDGAVVSAALDAANDGALVVLTCEARDIVSGIRTLLSGVESTGSARSLEILSRQLRVAISERAVPRADHDGTVAAYEVLEVTPTQRHFIRSDMIHQLPAQMAVGHRGGARWWPDALADLVLDGTCTLDAAVAASHQAGEVERALQRATAATGSYSPDLPHS